MRNCQSWQDQDGFPIFTGTPHNQSLIDVWWNNHFECKDLESSNWKQPFPVGCFRFQLAILSSDEFDNSPDFFSELWGESEEKEHPNHFFVSEKGYVETVGMPAAGISWKFLGIFVDGSEIRHFTPDEVGNEDLPNHLRRLEGTCEIVNAGFLNYQQYHQEIQAAKMKEVPLVTVLGGRDFPDRFWRWDFLKCFFFYTDFIENNSFGAK